MSNFIHVNVLVSFMSFFMLGSSECLAIEARNSKTNHPYLDMIEMQRNVYPQEKIHVVTDRDIYCGGDTVWFRIFVVDAATHQQTSMSKYAYVELLNPFGKVQERVKIIERNGIYSGYLPIYSDIYEGDYTLAAYTSFAENQGQEYFFKKPLKLISPNGDDFVIETNFISKGDTMVEGIFKVSKCDAENISKSKISYTMPDGEYVERPINKDFKRDFNLNKGENAVLATCGDHGKFLTIDYPENAYIKLAFYPEGGWLIAGDPCKV
ncbi:MAG: hypothetical protein K2I92_09305, partial [Muribaculaceae bacterium]|nr:hypothetical protein [Muribaculaceae bacterium]